MFPFSAMCLNGRSQFTTWNPADISNLVLSNGNLTAVYASGSNPGARGTTSKSSGKWGLTFTFQGGNTMAVGIANASQAFVGEPTSGSNCLVFLPNFLQIGGTHLGTSLSFGSGTSVIQMLFDFDAKLVWVKIDSDPWNEDGSADPAVGTGGRSFSTLAAGPYFPYLGPSLNPTVGATLEAYAGSYPNGFNPWDVV